MPNYLTEPAIYISIWPLPIAALIFSGIFGILVKLFSIEILNNNKMASFIVFSFAFLGLTAGYLSGISRESILGDVIPAILAIISGVSLYLIQQEKGDRVLVGSVIIVLSAGLLLGSLWGASARVYDVLAPASAPTLPPPSAPSAPF